MSWTFAWLYVRDVVTSPAYMLGLGSACVYLGLVLVACLIVYRIVNAFSSKGRQ